MKLDGGREKLRFGPTYNLEIAGLETAQEEELETNNGKVAGGGAKHDSGAAGRGVPAGDGAWPPAPGLEPSLGETGGSPSPPCHPPAGLTTLLLSSPHPGRQTDYS